MYAGLILITTLTTIAMASPTAPTADEFAKLQTGKVVTKLKSKGGMQIYACVGSKWTLKEAQAALQDGHGKTIGKHLFVANPEQPQGPLAPAWQLDDGSSIVGKKLQAKPSAKGVDLVALKAQINNGKGSLKDVTNVERLDTVGGFAPKEPCDAGRADERVPYEATYVFVNAKG